MQEQQYKFKLGEGVKDIVTGFTGVVMGQSSFLTGCNQYGVSPTKLQKDGERFEWQWFDENRLVKFGKSIKLPKQKKEVKGFDGNYSNNI